MNAEQQRAAAIRRLRCERNWTQRDVAVLFGRDVATVCRWEQGRHNPPLVSQIAQAFSVTGDEVLAACERCAYKPPAGFMCLACGTRGEEAKS